MKVGYVLGAIPVAIVCFGTATTAVNNGMVGVAAAILGNVVWRVACELLILGFSIHDRLVEIADGRSR